MILFDYKSSELFLNNKSYELSSVLGEDNFYFGLYELPSGTLKQAKFVVDLPPDFCTDLDKFQALLRREALINQHIKHFSVAIQSPFFSILPDFIMERSTETNISRDISALYQDPGCELVRHPLKELNSHFCFMAPKALGLTLRENVESFEVTHLNLRMYDWMKSTPGTYLFIHVLHETMQTIVVRQGQLLQTNVYKCRNKDDILYYALLNLNHLNLDPMETQVYVSGIIPNEGPAMKLLEMHIRKIALTDARNKSSYANVFLGKQKSYFFGLDTYLHADHKREIQG